MSHVCPFRGKAADFSGGSRALVGILQRSVFSLRRVLLIERGVHFIYDYNTCVYIYIYIYTCIYVCIHITYKHVCYDVILCNIQLCNHISMYVYVYTYIYMHICIHTRVRRRADILCAAVCWRAGAVGCGAVGLVRNQETKQHMYVCMYVCVYVYVCMCV